MTLVPPDVDTSLTASREGNGAGGDAVHLFFEHHAPVGDTAEGETDIPRACLDGPRTVEAARHLAVATESDGLWHNFLVMGVVHSVFVQQQTIGASDFFYGERLLRGDVRVGDRLSVVFERSGHEPSVLVDKHLMDTHLVTYGAVIELGVIHQVGLSVFGGDDGVVPLCTFSNGHVTPVVVGTHDFLASRVAVSAIIHHILGEDGAHAVGIGVGTVGLCRAEDAHLISSVGVVETVTHEKVVIVADAFDVGSLAADVDAAGHLLAEIGVAGHLVAGTVDGGVGHIVVA